MPCLMSFIRKGVPFDAPPFMVAGTVFAPDSYTIPTVSVHWIYKGVKQGAKKIKRIGILQ